MINEEIYMEIHILYKQGNSIRTIAKMTGLSRNTVKKHLFSETKPNYKPRPAKPQKLDPYKDYITGRLKQAKPNWIPATVIYREIQSQGYQGGLTRLRIFMRSLKPDSTSSPIIRFETKPAEQMQVDWAIFQRGQSPIIAFIATLGYSRASFVEFVDNEQLPTLLQCHYHAFEYFGGVPQSILYDNMKSVVRKRNAFGQGQHQFTASLWDFAKSYGFTPRLCQPYRAQTKGKVERFIHYLRYSFFNPLAAQMRHLDLKLDLGLLNAKVAIWLHDIANKRVHGTTKKIPYALLQEEQTALTPLPPKTTICSEDQQNKLSAKLQHDLCIYDSLLEEVSVCH